MYGIPILNGNDGFPDPRKAHIPDQPGLVALGGDLSPERLLTAYTKGIFPWSANPVSWWSPDPRAIIDCHQVHISRSLMKSLRSGRFVISRNQAFGEVIQACAEAVPNRPDTWIGQEFVEAYTTLHHLGHAHSVECWIDNQLAGGIYGIAIGGLFAGESMFFRQRDASKVALYALTTHLKEQAFELFDIQMLTEVTTAFGAYEIPRVDYLDRLPLVVKKNCLFRTQSPQLLPRPDPQ
ncbi:MAG TPA: leucyl/phenylalanyl-tRNA--protein transferase [Verrucomicrobiales bacterium]|nr:leucyl/phenylalanyl-tRNA--protein transferase [Verrucomicrobiales bacterium]HIL71498.1 leucyl/phenylalanyl-tRNA--protein transferase [Verrucomicrobiota bacterium]